MGDFKRYSSIILRYNKEILLCKRSPDKSLPNEWSIPGGHIEKNESPLNAASREFEEETNISLPKKELDLVGFINKYQSDGTTKKGLMYVFLYDSEKKYTPDLQLAKDGHEHTKCQYFSKKDLPITKKNDQLLKITKKLL